jgi:Tfp pilus assembly protein PilF
MKFCRNLVIVFCVIALSVFSFAGCKKKEGPAEKAGAKVDQALGTTKEGPVEQAGKKVDQAVEAAKEAATEAKK